MEVKSKFRGWEMEDLFQDANVFINAIRGTRAHMDSYNTIMDFEAFEKAWAEIKNQFTREEWIEACDYWLEQGYLSPMAGLLARTIQRRLGLL